MCLFSVSPSGCPLVVSRLCLYVAGGRSQEEHASRAGLPQWGTECWENSRNAQAVHVSEGLWQCYSVWHKYFSHWQSFGVQQQLAFLNSKILVS